MKVLNPSPIHYENNIPRGFVPRLLIRGEGLIPRGLAPNLLIVPDEMSLLGGPFDLRWTSSGV
jgi:hypothetical protein